MMYVFADKGICAASCQEKEGCENREAVCVQTQELFRGGKTSFSGMESIESHGFQVGHA